VAIRGQKIGQKRSTRRGEAGGQGNRSIRTELEWCSKRFKPIPAWTALENVMLGRPVVLKYSRAEPSRCARLLRK